VAAALWAQNWPQFRGSEARGLAVANLPGEISPTQNVLWKTAVPPGHSSPIVWGDRIFLTAAEGATRSQVAPGRVTDSGQLLTLSLDRRTGRILWRREAPRPRVEVYQPTNSPASSTPVTDGRLVYVFFGDFGLLAYDFAGRERWRLPLGPFNNPNGHGSSPVLVDDLVILLCDQDTGGFLIAVDKRSGRVRWKVARRESTRSYSTPGVVRPKSGPVELVIPGAYSLVSYAAATGEKLWWIGGLSWQPKSTPLVDGDRIYVHWWENGGESESATVTPEFATVLKERDRDGDGKLSKAEVDERMARGFGDMDLDHDGFIDSRDWDYYQLRRASRNALLAIQHGARGDLTGSRSILWSMQKFLPNCPTPLLLDGLLYLIKDGGILTVVDAQDGSMVKQGRLTGALDTYYASPVAASGRVYFLSQAGKLTTIRAGRDWQWERVADFGEECFATPALAGGRLYLRTRSALYAF
jgi:outer membrane protein assembly factor BamB